jgi:WD40 repeat protein
MHRKATIIIINSYKYVFLLLASLSMVHLSISQQKDASISSSDSLTLLFQFSERVTDFEVDNLGYIYLLGAQQQIKKLTPDFDSMAVFNDLRHFGKLHSIDVSNPLKVLLFYRDFGSIIILDRLLNVKTILNLRKAGIVQATAITQSYDNNIWIYDALDNAVKKIDESGRVLTTSPDFRVVFDHPPQPESLHDFNKFLYAYDPTIGMLVMDYFGAYKNKVSLLGWKNLQGIAQGIAATDDNGLVYYRPGTINVLHQTLPKEMISLRKIRINKQKLYVLDGQNTLKLFRLPEHPIE